MRKRLKTAKLKQSYKDQLLKIGVDCKRAEQAAKVLTREELLLASEIWPDWAAVFSQVEEQISIKANDASEIFGAAHPSSRDARDTT